MSNFDKQVTVSSDNFRTGIVNLHELLCQIMICIVTIKNEPKMTRLYDMLQNAQRWALFLLIVGFV
jgi:hypothetical protein